MTLQHMQCLRLEGEAASLTTTINNNVTRDGRKFSRPVAGNE